jgi:nitrate reductase cytochrome c-type subunit
MKTVFTIVFIAALALVVGSIVADKAGVPDTEIGLSKTSVFDIASPPATLHNESEPGDDVLIPRGFPEQPSQIPHGVLEFLPITFDDNQCVDCHAVEKKEPGEPTPIPPSHYTDLRHAPGKIGEELVGARYNCLSCHVSPGGNAPLVGNSFGR